MAQIQSTPGASSQSLHPPNCLFSPAFMNCKPPKAKPVLSQCSIIPNSCSKGTSLLTAHGILQPRVVLEGRASTACLGDGVLQGLRLQSGPLRRGEWVGGKKPFQGSRHRKEKSKESRGCRGQVPSCSKTFSSNPSLQAKPRSLNPPAPVHTAAASGCSMGKLHHKSTHSLESSRTTPSFTLEHQPSPVYSQGGSAQQGGAASPLLQSHTSYTSAQIASLNVIALSQFHEFNIVPGLLFA